MRRLSKPEKCESWDRFEAAESLRSISRRLGLPSTIRTQCGVWRVRAATTGFGITTELLGTEQRVIEHATRGVVADRWVVPHRVVEARLARHRHLTDGQRDMVCSFAASGSVVDVGVGPAGSGKTAVMVVISELAALTGTPIVGAALAARTASGLQAATGIPSTTVARFLSEGRHGAGLASGAVVVIDEASMVGSRHLAEVCDLVEYAAGKLILMGDDHQLPEIDAGGLLSALTNRLPAVELTDNIRQCHAWEWVALAELRDGSPDEAIDAYRQHKRLIVGENRGEMIARAVDDWFRHVTAAGDLTSGLLIAHNKEAVAALNEQARTRLAASRRLNGPALETTERVFQAGDRILCCRNQVGYGSVRFQSASWSARNGVDGALCVN